MKIIEYPHYNQVSLAFDDSSVTPPLPKLKGQLLKWVGNKQKFAPYLVKQFPRNFGTYFEPFLGSGGVLATLAPERAIASDSFAPLVEIWNQLKSDPEGLVDWYRSRWNLIEQMGKVEAYEFVKANYNHKANGADLLFLSRVCYGGVVRFRKSDGFMSTPCGPHKPMHPKDFHSRVKIWHERTKGAEFKCADYAEIMKEAKSGDLVYCDPPYVHSQTILYGAQSFSLEHLLTVIEDCKSRGVMVALSIDGTKKSGNVLCGLPIPDGLFERELFVELGSSMLKRFQLADQTSEEHLVSDRLLLTY